MATCKGNHAARARCIRLRTRREVLEFLSRSVDLRRRLHGECYLRHTWGMGYGTGWVGTCGRLRFTNKAVINLPGVDPPPLTYT